jgi:hypothetical protein
MIEWIRVIASRLLAVFNKQHLDRDFDNELRETPAFADRGI